ncbi:putative ribonuclease H-like domain-containing protein, partial [Tanacetum coccineum]
SSEDAGTDDDDDDVDEDFLVDEENEIVEPDVDVHLFGISMDLPFDNIGVTNLVSDDVLEGEDVDVINADGFDSDPGNDEEKNYRKRRLAELRTEMEGVINASGQWKYSFYTGQKFTTPKEAKDRVYLHSIESRRNLKLYKNDGVRIRARCDGKVPVFTMSQGTNDDNQASSSILDARDKGDLYPWVLEIKHCTYKFLSKKIFEQVRVNPDIPVKAVQDQLQRELEVQISMSKAFRAKAKVEREIRGDHGIIPAIKTVYPTASATNVRDFEKYMLELKTMNPKAHKWLNKIPAEHWAKSYFPGRAKSDLLLNNICEVFNGKIVGGRDKPVITLLKYINEYCMKRIMNVQGVIDKCTSPLTHTVTRIMESIKKEAHLMKVQWNEANKYQVSGSLGDQCVVDVVSMTCSCKKWELIGIPCKHVVIACWNMDLNDRATPPPETLPAAAGKGGTSSLGVASQGSSHMSETRNADGREMGDGVPTQSSVAGGASE